MWCGGPDPVPGYIGPDPVPGYIGSDPMPGYINPVPVPGYIDPDLQPTCPRRSIREAAKKVIFLGVRPLRS